MISTIQNSQVKTLDILIAGAGAGGTGEFLHDKEMTGSPLADLAIKILVPIITGCIFPLLKDYIALLIARTKKERKYDNSQDYHYPEAIEKDVKDKK